MGSVQCSICSRGKAASDLVNEMLFAGEFLTIIAAKTGLSKSAIHRHKRGKCKNSFITWKADRLIRSKRQKVAGRRTVVRWFGLEGGTKKGPVECVVAPQTRYSFGREPDRIAPSDVRTDDTIIDVIFDEPKPARRRLELIAVGSPETQSQD